MLAGQQLRLFDTGPPAPTAPPSFDPTFARAERVELEHGAWVEHVPGWLASDLTLFAHLERVTAWQVETRRMYDRVVTTPRLLGGVVAGTGSSRDGSGRDGSGHPLLEAMRQTLSTRYGEEFVRVSLACYRHGRDSVALHGDTTARDMLEPTHVATVSLGGARRLVMKPTAGGRTIELTLRGGDLFVMGGTAQRTWRHGIPKVAEADPRIVVMFRPSWGERYEPGS